MRRVLPTKSSKKNGVDPSSLKRDEALASAGGNLGRLQGAGNSAVTDLLRRTANAEGTAGPIDTNAGPRPANDACEQEAQRVAATVTGGGNQIASAPDDRRPRERSREPEEAGGQPRTSEPSGKGGQPLPEETLRSFDARFGADFSGVRVHTDDRAQEAAAAMGARAFTVGNEVTFAPDQYQPDTPRGQNLLAHELTHVVQQGGASSNGGMVTQTAAPQVQRSIFEDAWEGIKAGASAVGGAVASAARWVGEAVGTAAGWVGERVRDASMWVVNLIRDLPGRLARLATTLWEGLSGIVTFIPEAIQALASGGLRGFADWLWEKAKAGGAWVLRLVSRVFDVLGGPELVEFLWHIVTKARPLSGPEIAAGSSVLGPSAVRWGDVRVSQGGLLSLIFSLNNKRAFVMFHTINLPEGEALDTVVHELTHVVQYEHTGSLYLGQAIHAQATRGGNAYNYGGPAGLVSAKASGKHFRDFNREEQGQIAQDYYRYVIEGRGTLSTDERDAYDFFIQELRAGQV